MGYALLRCVNGKVRLFIKHDWKCRCQASPRTNENTYPMKPLCFTKSKVLKSRYRECLLATPSKAQPTQQVGYRLVWTASSPRSTEHAKTLNRYNQCFWLGSPKRTPVLEFIAIYWSPVFKYKVMHRLLLPWTNQQIFEAYVSKHDGSKCLLHSAGKDVGPDHFANWPHL